MSMLRRLCVLLLGAVAFAQEGGDDGGITVDEAPSGPEPAPFEAAPARVPGATVATVEIRKKGYTFSIPADWTLAEDEEKSTELTWKILLPGSKRRGTLRLFREEAGGDPRSAPYDYAARIRREDPKAVIEVAAKPACKLDVRYPEATGSWVNCDIFLLRKNHLYLLQLACSNEDFGPAEADFIAAAQSFTADAEAAPIPKGYRLTKDGIWLIARAPSVSAPLTALTKALDDAEKRFKRMHGALPKFDDPFVVLVHASSDDAASIEPNAAHSSGGFYADVWRRRLFAIPFDRDDAEHRGWLAGEAHQLLLIAKYGDNRPAWIWVGESTIARAEAFLGKPLPILDAGFFSWLEDLKLHRLDELDELRRTDSEAWGKESLFHVAALRGGTYSKEYGAFLADLEEKGDALGAFERHLAEIDRERMLAATYDYAKTKIKPEKKEEKPKKK